MGRLSDVRGVGRRARRGRRHGDRLGRRPARDGRRQRRDRQGGRVLPDDDQEDPARPDDRRRRTGCPLVYLVDSSGVFLPMQDEVFPDDDDFGRIFRNNAVLSARGHSAVRGHHGELRRGRSLSAGPLRHRADDGGLGSVSGRPGAGEGGHRPGDLARGAGRCRTCTRPSAARSIIASRTTTPAWPGCAG